MRKVLGYLLKYQKEIFDWKVYSLIALFLASCIAFNYTLNFQHSYTNVYYGEPVQCLWVFAFHVFPMLVICLILLFFGKIENCFVCPEFWLKRVSGLGMLSVNRYFYATDYLTEFFSRERLFFIRKSCDWRVFNID